MGHNYLYRDKISIIQKNAVRIITLAAFNAHNDPIFKKLKILKIKDHITLQYCLLVYDYINNKLPKPLYHILILLDMDLTQYIENQWNYFTKQTKENLSCISRNKLKKTDN